MSFRVTFIFAETEEKVTKRFGSELEARAYSAGVLKGGAERIMRMRVETLGLDGKWARLPKLPKAAEVQGLD